MVRRWIQNRERVIRDGDEYTIDEERQVRLLEVTPAVNPPPIETQGEPWGWTKGAPYPRGWREDGNYGTD